MSKVNTVHFILPKTDTIDDSFCPLRVQGQQLLQNLFVAQVGLPARGGDGRIIESTDGRIDVLVYELYALTFHSPSSSKLAE